MAWAVLACLARRRGRICSRSQIESQLDPAGLSEAASNFLAVIVSRLRKKLGADTISTHRGLGYRLEAGAVVACCCGSMPGRRRCKPTSTRWASRCAT